MGLKENPGSQLNRMHGHQLHWCGITQNAVSTMGGPSQIGWTHLHPLTAIRGPSWLSYAILDCKTESVKIVKSPDSPAIFEAIIQDCDLLCGLFWWNHVCLPFLAIFNINTVRGQKTILQWKVVPSTSTRQYKYKYKVTSNWCKRIIILDLKSQKACSFSCSLPVLHITHCTNVM